MTEGLKGVSADKSAPNYLGILQPEKRQSAKAFALGVPYGMSGYKLAFQLGCSSEQGEKLVENYLNNFPGLKTWMQTTQDFVCQNGYVRTLGGRIRHLHQAKEYFRKFGLTVLDSLQLYKDYGHDEVTYDHMKKIRRELRNFINNGSNVQIQATVAAIINRASIQIAREFKQKNLDAVIVAQIHDQLIVEAFEADKAVVAEIVQKHMVAEAVKLVPDVPIPAEPHFGYNLQESKG